jgi:hypothetical protein
MNRRWYPPKPNAFTPTAYFSTALAGEEMFAFMFPEQARQLSDQAKQLSQQTTQLSQQTTQLGQQAALISRLYAANAYLRAQNDTLQSTDDFAEKKRPALQEERCGHAAEVGQHIDHQSHPEVRPALRH